MALRATATATTGAPVPEPAAWAFVHPSVTTEQRERLEPELEILTQAEWEVLV
jgi:hypothetical protein